MLHGNDKLISPECTYTGEFKRNEMHGKGMIEWQDLVYTGEI